MKLSSSKELTQFAKQLGLNDWTSLTTHVQKLPYGRNANREDLSLVLTEGKGSCSSKHALLRQIAIENNFEDIKLILGIYKMNKDNTPGIGNVLDQIELDYIPEAHCYLSINGVRTDLTNANSDFDKLAIDILFEQEIQPEDVAEEKVLIHKEFLKKWIEEQSFEMDLEEVWNLREKCILNLSS